MNRTPRSREREAPVHVVEMVRDFVEGAADVLQKTMAPSEEPAVRLRRTTEPCGSAHETRLRTALELRPPFAERRIDHRRSGIPILEIKRGRGELRALHRLRHQRTEDAADVKGIDHREAVEPVADGSRVHAAHERLRRQRGRVRDGRRKGETTEHIALYGSRDCRKRLARERPGRALGRVIGPAQRLRLHRNTGQRDGRALQMEDHRPARRCGIADHHRVGRASDEMRDQRVRYDPEPQHEPPVAIGLGAAPGAERIDLGAGKRLLVLGGKHLTTDRQLRGERRSPGEKEDNAHRSQTRHCSRTTRRSLVAAPKNPTPPVIFPRNCPKGLSSP